SGVELLGLDRVAVLFENVLDQVDGGVGLVPAVEDAQRHVLLIVLEVRDVLRPVTGCALRPVLAAGIRVVVTAAGGLAAGVRCSARREGKRTGGEDASQLGQGCRFHVTLLCCLNRMVQGYAAAALWARSIGVFLPRAAVTRSRKIATKLNSSHVSISYAVFCLK